MHITRSLGVNSGGQGESLLTIEVLKSCDVAKNILRNNSLEIPIIQISVQKRSKKTMFAQTLSIKSAIIAISNPRTKKTNMCSF